MTQDRMKIEPIKMTVGEISKNYTDDQEGGVTGLEGKLNIRPPYQREFVYNEKQRTAVMRTVLDGYPLNVMYWAVNEDGTYEVMDGQQRTISLCQYVDGEYAIDIDGHPRYFHNLPKTTQEKILDYELMVYACDGDDEERLAWFEIINIAGLKLTRQERRNAIYTGPWLANAKSIFSRPTGAAQGLGGRYVTARVNRQELLETALNWKSGGKISEYMSEHQHDPSAAELWLYFQAVIAWVQATFTTHRAEMKSVNWGELYNRYKDETYDPAELEAETKRLRIDDEVQSNSGIYPYLLTGDEKYLNLRAFTPAQKIAAYEKQDGRCARGTHCSTPGNDDGQKVFSIEEMEGDHITPWSQGGKTDVANLQMLCLRCNREKGSK